MRPAGSGYAPAATPLPTVETNDVVYLRTATSIEQTLVETYERIVELGVLDETATTVLERLIEDHRAAVTATAELTTQAGGEPYECANSWYVERVVTPILTVIEGDEDEDIPPSDDPARDSLTTIDGLESMAGAMYQQMVELLVSQDLRAEGMRFGAAAARHGAAVAILATGAPDGYVSPTLTGGEVTPDETGLVPLYAISTQFGSLTAIPITIGAAERRRRPHDVQPGNPRRQLLRLRRRDLRGLTAVPIWAGFSSDSGTNPAQIVVAVGARGGPSPARRDCRTMPVEVATPWARARRGVPVAGQGPRATAHHLDESRAARGTGSRLVLSGAAVQLKLWNVSETPNGPPPSGASPPAQLGAPPTTLPREPTAAVIKVDDPSDGSPLACAATGPAQTSPARLAGGDERRDQRGTLCRPRHVRRAPLSVAYINLFDGR